MVLSQVISDLAHIGRDTLDFFISDLLVQDIEYVLPSKIHSDSHVNPKPLFLIIQWAVLLSAWLSSWIGNQFKLLTQLPLSCLWQLILKIILISEKL